MFDNESYKDNLEDAVMENSVLVEQDDAEWFYKKWSFFSKDDPEQALNSDSHNEYIVSEKMKAIKKMYRDTYEKAELAYPSAQMFNQVKSNIEECKLFLVFQAMPKPALLHVHNAAALSLDGLLQLLKEWDKDVIYIAYESDNDFNRMQGTLFYGVLGLQAKGVMKVQDYLLKEENEKQLRDWLSFENVESTKQLKYRWDKFNHIFMRTGDLFDSKQYYMEYHKRFFLECLRDKIYYVELRCSFQNFSSKLVEENQNAAFGYSSEFLTVIAAAADAANAAYKAEYEALGGEISVEPTLNTLAVRVILCARRDLSSEVTEQKEKLMRKLDAAILWKKLDTVKKNFIVGFDFVSEEDRGKSTYSYYKDILYGKTFSGYAQIPENVNEINRLKVTYADTMADIVNSTRAQLIDLYLHAGESLWMEQDNVIDAVIASSTRIGHGFQMGVYPGVVKTYSQQDKNGTVGPILEICPISNQLLGYFPDLRNHTSFALMKQGVPCVLGNDDPQILGNPGLSYDFWEMYMASNARLSLVKAMVFLGFLFQRAAANEITIHQLDTVQDLEHLYHTFQETYWKPFLVQAKAILE